MRPRHYDRFVLIGLCWLYGRSEFPPPQQQSHVLHSLQSCKLFGVCTSCFLNLLGSICPCRRALPLTARSQNFVAALLACAVESIGPLHKMLKLDSASLTLWKLNRATITQVLHLDKKCRTSLVCWLNSWPAGSLQNLKLVGLLQSHYAKLHSASVKTQIYIAPASRNFWICSGLRPSSSRNTSSVCCPNSGPAHFVLPGVLLMTGSMAGMTTGSPSASPGGCAV